MDYTLTATNITDTSFDIIITAIVATVGSKVLTLGVEDTSSPGSGNNFMITETGMAQGETKTFPVGGGSGMTINSGTEYGISLDWSGMEMATPITVTTKSSGYDTPRTATQEQWEDLADRVNVRPIISSSITPPTSVEFVSTNNLSNGAVTPAKIDMASLIDVLYPVGCYFETSDTTFDPNVSWGGTWAEDSAGRVTVSQDSGTFTTVGGTGGEETHTLSEAELPSVSGYFEIHGEGSGTEFHKIHGNATGTLKSNQYKSLGSTATTGAGSYANPGFAFGSGQAHNNLQPYVIVKRWHRTA